MAFNHFEKFRLSIHPDCALALLIASFITGIGIVSYLRAVPPVLLCVSILLVFTLIGGMYWEKLSRSIGLRQVLLHGCFLALGFIWADYQAQTWLHKRLSPQWVGKNIVVTGTIINLPVEEKKYTRFLLHTQSFAGEPRGMRLQMSWQNPHPPLTVGERWQFTVRLKPPHALTNFGAFNRLRFLWAQDIHAAGYVVSHSFSQRLSASGPRFWVARWRERLQRQIRRTVHDPTAAAIISALTIGVENGLTEADWRVLQRTGTVHLVVIAGLHIGLMVLVAYFLGNQLWRCFPKLLLRLPAQHAGAIAALIFALGYGALAGFGVPAQRAVIMIVLLTLSELCYREMTVWRRILLAFWIVVIVQPGALFAAGLWLSFAAVACIAYSVSGEWRKTAHWRQWLRIQWALFLGLTPVTIYFFQQFSLVSMIANLPAIIWIGWVIVPLCLLAAIVSAVSLSTGAWIFTAAAYLLTPLWHFLEWLAAWPFAGWQYAVTNPWLLVLALLGAAWCLAPRKIPRRWLGVLGFLPMWLVQPAKPPPGSYWVTVLDVGQGLALIVQTAHHVLVYDAGARIPAGFDAGRDVVSPYLLTLGVKQINVLMVSHGDNDHSGGAAALLDQWPVQRLLTSIPALFPGYQPQHCEAGQQWQWDGVLFRVLGPPAGGAYQDNNSSCVVQIGAPGWRTLLTGDIEADAETALVAQYYADLRSQILVVPHHGSRTSSTTEFLQRVQPEYAIFSLGYFNRFHFPAPSTVARYQSVEAAQWLTAHSGAIRIQILPGKSITFQFANPQKYFWNK